MRLQGCITFRLAAVSSPRLPQARTARPGRGTTGGLPARRAISWTMVAVFPALSLAVHVRLHPQKASMERSVYVTTGSGSTVSVTVGWPVELGLLSPPHTTDAMDNADRTGAWKSEGHMKWGVVYLRTWAALLAQTLSAYLCPNYYIHCNHYNHYSHGKIYVSNPIHSHFNTWRWLVLSYLKRSM